MGLLARLPENSENKKGWPWDQETVFDVNDSKKHWPKISIVTPSYNQGIFLEETLRSILLQNYPDLELIVIDGGSKDNSVEIIKKYEPWITYWISEKDNGQSDAINKGIRKATGEILNWINSDDLLTTGSLKKVAEIFSQQPGDVGLIHGGTVLFTRKKVVGHEWGLKDPSLERYLAGITFSQPSSFFLKKYYDMVGGQINEKLHYGMDYELYSRLLLVSKFKKIDHLLSKYRFHDGSKSVALTNKFTSDWIQAFINLIVNLKLEKIKMELSDLKIFDEHFKASERFTFSFDQIYPDEKKMSYYFLSDIMRADYRNGNLKRAKLLATHITQNHEIVNENHVPLIIHRLTYYPLFFIAAAKKVKSYLN